MAHMQKFTRGQTGRMFNHFERTENDGVDRSNKNIDSSKTHENYNLAKDLQPLSGTDFLKQRIDNDDSVRCQNRKDINVMVDWVITKPENVPNDAQSTKDFFSATFDFMCNRYGKENVISAYVHMDETTPHMHFSFIPIKPDEKKGGYKVCAKEVVNRNDLRSFHDDLAKNLENTLGYRPDVVRPAEERDRVADLSLDEYKRMQSEKKLNDIETKIADAEERLKDMPAAMNDLQNLIDAHIDLQEQIDAKSEILKVYSQAADVPDVQGKEKRNPITGKETVELPKEDFDALKARAARTTANEIFYQALGGMDLVKMSNEANGLAERYKEENDELKQQTIEAKQEAAEARQNVEDAEERGYKRGYSQAMNHYESYVESYKSEKDKAEAECKTAKLEALHAKHDLREMVDYSIKSKSVLEKITYTDGSTVQDTIDEKIKRPQPLQERIDDLEAQRRQPVTTYNVSRDWDDFER